MIWSKTLGEKPAQCSPYLLHLLTSCESLLSCHLHFALPRMQDSCKTIHLGWTHYVQGLPHHLKYHHLRHCLWDSLVETTTIYIILPAHTGHDIFIYFESELVK